MSLKTKIFKIGLPLLFLACGALVLRFLILNKPTPQKVTKQDRGALVEIMEVEKYDRQVQVFATGTVQAAQEVTITPQVNGRVIYAAQNFVSGGFFKKGALLFSIEDIDYTLALEQAKASLARAEVDLATIESRALIARSEWEQLNKNPQKKPNPLVLLEPQVKNAQAGLDSAKAAVSQAQLNLSRTKIYAPFNCLVRREQIDIGQYLRQGNPVATVAATDTAEIIVPLPLAELTWLSVPRQGSGRKGSNGTLELKVAGSRYQWQGHIIRSLGEADPQSRMMRVVVEVESPYNPTASNNSPPDLAFGVFVDVILHGRQLEGVFILPHKAIREHNTVWIMDENNSLKIREVTIIRQEKDAVLIKAGLDPGDKVVLTNLSAAAEGMKLRARNQEISQ